jgi:hypothetical protein
MKSILRNNGPGDAASLSERIQVCAGCHVGAPAGNGAPLRDMNHDMIAAGHPRLNFEYTAYLANMPPHWKNPETPNAKSWAIGRVASANAALELLADRAKNENQPRAHGATLSQPWPEFAEHDCFACHHDLVSKSFRQDRDYLGKDRKAGSLLPNRWQLAFLPDALTGSSADDALKIGAQIASLQMLLTAAAPPADQVKTAAKELSDSLRLVIPQLEARQPADYETARQAFKKHHENLTAAKAGASWDQAAQLYFGLVAADEGKTAAHDELYARLKFQLDYASPKGAFPPWPPAPKPAPGD